MFDQADGGGNEDGLIDARDRIFAHLQVWVDANHDGVSQQGELRSLAYVGVEAFSLEYRESRRQDQFGNEFRYRAKITTHAGNRWAYDVFFDTEQRRPSPKASPENLPVPKCPNRSMKESTLLHTEISGGSYEEY